ncbi:helix-turn-helix domain-containing protein [Actinomadura yumaensis]|uniref:helix-turn-helix domain-containing protein n=1 Tax=Actinomadura yumaensis TaxID=111807 RepID=UPI003617FA38
MLRTAQRLFAAQGLDVSLDEIARRAGVGPGTVHRHFPTKQALYLAVAIDQLRHLVAEGRRSPAPTIRLPCSHCWRG